MKRHPNFKIKLNVVFFLKYLFQLCIEYSLYVQLSRHFYYS